MYAIVFKLNHQALTLHHGFGASAQMYDEIGPVLSHYGFTRYQNDVYFGNVPRADAVSCVLAVMDLAKHHPRFASFVEDVRMLRIEENNDLMPAVRKAAE
ncbi:virulence factor [Escherichia coli]|uniref:virulence factor n=1 Tax=Escherichia coli TaxID=562 RepID=UPI000BDF94F8|nr:virulence factor [Escherichia coli]EER0916710.1 virulence factor [Escherichia coli O168:H8]EES8553799.1 virulence factor [Escherichia coli O168]EER0947480.1 virulence factor [Escherichia coli O168:H8]EER2485477.1 virulence factor [Escherichia coli]EER2541191.1 virulence factor [Escherichia coli]